MSVIDNINHRLAEFFSNGRAEVGLEVGADAGLSPNEYIQIPASLRKAWAYRTVGTGNYDRQAADTTATLRGKQGWTVVSDRSTRVIIVGGKTYIRPAANVTGTGTEVDNIYVDAHTYDDVRRFIVANTGHVRDGDLKVDQVYWVHAVRFWAVVTGLVTGSKQREFTEVADPTGDLSSADQHVERILGFQNEALTAIAARATSWRKSNHATGGDLAAGFPRRWLTQMKWWPTSGERSTNMPVQRQLTDAFYIATHAAAVHNALALMAPTDEGHWASIDPACGILLEWDIRESTSLRMAPKTQVAGTAMVVDAMVTFKMLIGEGLAPLLENLPQWQSLKSQHAAVESGGVCVASYASWFLDGHPLSMVKRAFNQKDSTCAELVGELGAAAVKYYARSTIGQSMALDNAMNQMATETSKNRWIQLAKEKSSSTNLTAIKAYRRITGASAGKTIANLASDDNDIVQEAVREYNALLIQLGEGVGVPSPPQVNAADVFRVTPPETGDEAEAVSKV
jgi:hypothetical protein